MDGDAAAVSRDDALPDLTECESICEDIWKISLIKCQPPTEHKKTKRLCQSFYPISRGLEQ